MKGRTPNTEEKAWMDRITQIGCVVCKLHHGVYTPAEVHHIDGKTKPDAHLKTIPLCYRHHRGGEDNEIYTARHPFKRAFESRYGTQFELLERTKELVAEKFG